MRLAEQVAVVRRTLYRRLSRRLVSRTERPWHPLQALYVIEEEDLRTQVALAERMLMDAPAVSRLVAGLEKEGLLARLPGADRRSVRLEVTPAGRREVAMLVTILDELDRENRQLLTAQELRTLGALLAKLQAGLQALEETRDARAEA